MKSAGHGGWCEWLRGSRARQRGRVGGRPPAFDKDQYRRRSAAERCDSKWKQFRPVAGRGTNLPGQHT
ncbi:hypothetical protein [Streptomyces sp. NPDC050704]|uniref:hypothetical protein n=1 Tax=Streptomyces sp. NPDC050704 TaxID=3157219 RepID=UPI003436A613